MADLPDWLTAFGTIGATGAAVYFGGISDRLRRPSLSLHFDADNGFDRQLERARRVDETADEVDQAWLRLRVRNKPRRFAAEDVEVHVSDVTELDRRAGQSPTTPRSLGGLPLVWSNTDRATRGLVPPGADASIDFGWMEWTDPRAAPAPLTLAVRFTPIDNRHELTSLRVEVGITVTARNADPIHYQLVAFCDGTWEDPPWDHVAIESLSPLRVRPLVWVPSWWRRLADTVRPPVTP